MKIAFIHYHLKTGGVTTVLRQQVEAIKDESEVVVLTGLAPELPFPADTITIDGLGYDTFYPTPRTPAEIAESIINAINSKFGEPCDVLHIHNPTLAKNKNFLMVLKCLQHRNINLLLQIHDFAEDGRPLSYYSEAYVTNCHYGVINSRDYDLLLKAGLKPNGLHKIFNIVKEFAFNQPDGSPQSHVLYPIRALRRKNIGEAILLSLFFGNNQPLVITLPPNSPVDITSYEGWKTFVAENQLKVQFDAGLRHDFSQLVQTSSYLITTSITEGFGFSFLEPWLAKKLVWGRKLSDICRDFEKNGIQLDHLYERLRVPLGWIGKQDFFSKWQACIKKNYAVYGHPVNDKIISSAFVDIIHNDSVDFGLLDEAFQKKVILRVLSTHTAAKTLLQLNPSLIAPGIVAEPENLIRSNRIAVKKHYNQNLYRQRLLKIYDQVAHVPVRHRLDKTVLLSHFLNLHGFSLLKWGDYVE